jgi:hypothetical protein
MYRGEISQHGGTLYDRGGDNPIGSRVEWSEAESREVVQSGAVRSTIEYSAAQCVLTSVSIVRGWKL